MSYYRNTLRTLFFIIVKIERCCSSVILNFSIQIAAQFSPPGRRSVGKAPRKRWRDKKKNKNSPQEKNPEQRKHKRRAAKVVAQSAYNSFNFIIAVITSPVRPVLRPWSLSALLHPSEVKVKVTPISILLPRGKRWSPHNNSRVLMDFEN